jgi:hypothetical protein
MRTTVMFPPDLMRAAKARSGELGESLKTLLTRALAAELAHAPSTRTKAGRVALPLFGASDGPTVHLSNADLEHALADADAAAGSGRKSAIRPRGRKHR